VSRTLSFKWNKVITDRLRKYAFCLPLQTSHITQSADGSHLATTIYERQGAISNCIEAKIIQGHPNFRIWCTKCISFTGRTFRTSHSRQIFYP